MKFFLALTISTYLLPQVFLFNFNPPVDSSLIDLTSQSEFEQNNDDVSAKRILQPRGGKKSAPAVPLAGNPPVSNIFNATRATSLQPNIDTSNDATDEPLSTPSLVNMTSNQIGTSPGAQSFRVNVDIGISTKAEDTLLLYSSKSSTMCFDDRCRDACKAMAGIHNILIGGAQLGDVIVTKMIRTSILPCQLFYGIAQAKLQFASAIINWPVYATISFTKGIVRTILNILKIKMNIFLGFQNHLNAIIYFCKYATFYDIKCQNSFRSLEKVISNGIENQSLCKSYLTPMVIAKSQCTYPNDANVLHSLEGTIASMCRALVV